MIGRNAAWRVGGVLALVAAGGTSLLHRSVWAAHLDGPASGLELVLGLTSFVLASAGVLLLIHGARLHDGWVRDCGHGDPARDAEPSPETESRNRQASLNAIAADPYTLAGGRVAIAMLLADRAIRAAADDGKYASHPPDTIKAGHSS